MTRKNASLTRMEGPEGLKWELGFAYFWLGNGISCKWDKDLSRIGTKTMGFVLLDTGI